MKLVDIVGNTPMIELETGVARTGIRLFAKLEGNNPAGSVKDRPARSMILRAEARGDLRPGIRLLEPTSGNTGIALAMIAAARGYAIELVMPENATAERVDVMRAFGAEVILTPATSGMEGAIDVARERFARGGYLMLDQFANADNWRAHYESTGPEIWRDTAGGITHFVSAMGTTGTIMGVSRYLKEQRPEVAIVGCQPTDGSSIPGIRRWSKEYLPKIYEPARVDRVVDIAQADAEQTARSLARREGLFCGASSGGAVWAARAICAELDAAGKDGTLVCIICDRGDRYLSSPLFTSSSRPEPEAGRG
jgi:cysteine synthase B